MNIIIPQLWKINKQSLLLLLPISLLGSLVLLIQSPYFIEELAQSNNLVLGVSADFVLTIPILYYFIIRKTRISNFTVLYLMIAGLFLGLYFLPQDNQTYLELFKTYFFPLIELAILCLVVWKVRTAIKKYTLLKQTSSKISFDFFTTLKNSCREILPQLPASVLATEIAMVYYSIISWKVKKVNSSQEFTYHATSGTIGLLGALIFTVAIETIAIHLLLAEWNSGVAWGLTGLSIYTGFQLLAFAKSFSRRPILIENDILYLRYGIMAETEIKIKNIKSIEISEKPLKELIETEGDVGKREKKLYQKLSPLGNLEQHNVVIRLYEKEKLNSVYGIKREYQVLAFYVDGKIDFKNRIEKRITT